MRRAILPLAIVFGALLTPSLRPAQPDADPRPRPRDRAASRSIVADGFEVNLFAADPILAKPIQMNFDPAGRLWVASSEVYPQIKPGQVANDKVVDPRGSRRRRQGRQDDGLRRRPADPDRHRAGRRRGLRRQQHRAAPPEGHRRRRQGRPPPGRALGVRHRGYPPHPPHAAVGLRRAALLQPVDLHP